MYRREGACYSCISNIYYDYKKCNTIVHGVYFSRIACFGGETGFQELTANFLEARRITIGSQIVSVSQNKKVSQVGMGGIAKI